MVRSHLDVFQESTSRYHSAPLFRLPHISPSTGKVDSWGTISYQEFRHDVELYARHWMCTLGHDGVQQGSVVGLWLSGITYIDCLHVYGISRAGYIPQLFSLRLPNPVVVMELLRRANAKALIHDSCFTSVLQDCDIPRHCALTTADIPDVNETLHEITPVQNEDDIAFIFHTSGSTSGSPKLVPCSYKWFNSVVEKSHHISKPRNADRQDVTVFIGSMSHIAQTFMFLGTLQHGSCVIQPTKLDYSSEELIDMITRCGLNRLNAFGSWLGMHLRNARQDPKLLNLLVNLDDVIYSGLALPRDEEQLAYKNGIKLRNLFGSTEIGGMLLSGGHGKNDALLRPLPGTSYKFVPISTNTEGVHQSTGALYELVILSDSPDCPHESLRGPDGHLRTGDLFQEVSPGWYVSRGRDDDWIKSETSLRCDTKAIEDNARAVCGNLIAECVVVGSGRPSPVMFIEPAVEMDHDKLKKEIIRKTRQFHSRRYMHERITSPDMLVIVTPKTLPRTATKGNIRRKAVEEAFTSELDRIFTRSR
ncbi:acetyl-CoA synthetase-like protein [Coprinopsis marcescibilis]|uniref:Acetyl-CoA synthetase-like protein n=1 Tax=Coprinopsis marcescibilis TaxID=230819 RepID=A0A5C3KFU7_COPMA|nr:acetyl-CoA synthetase-like protein [Coprinopsis marcescibilis]